MIVVTGATGNLGTLVLEQLLERVPAQSVRALARTPDKASAWAERGVEVVQADYEDPASLRAAFEGADKVLLISGSEVGRRLPQHRNVIEAAVEAGVGLLVYTSLAKADTSRSVLAEEHVPTEETLRASGFQWVILRNGWYLENYTENLAGPLAMGAFYGAAGKGRVSAAARADYAAAAVAALTEDGHAGQTYELGGQPFDMAELASVVSHATGKELPYVDLPEEAYRQALVEAGVPEVMAGVLANADTALAHGDLEVDPATLTTLIGRAPTSLGDAVRAALA